MKLLKADMKEKEEGVIRFEEMFWTSSTLEGLK